MEDNKDHYQLFEVFLERLKKWNTNTNTNFIEKARDFYADENLFKKDNDDHWLKKLIKKVKDNKNETIKEIFINSLWLWYLPISDVDVESKKKKLEEAEKGVDFTNNEKLSFPDKGLVKYGLGAIQMKSSIQFIINDIILDIILLEKQDNTDLKKVIKEKCLHNNETGDTMTKNMLLHLCYKEKYPSIASKNHKEMIRNTFECLLSDEEKENATIDEKIIAIQNKLNNIQKNFYDTDIRPLWENVDINNELSNIQLLEYKKAMVLYGPPGTGKTYTAKELAKSILVRHHFKQKKNNSLQSEEIIKILKNKYDDRIYYLQFHINYNYEDFIAGQTIVDRNVETKKGFIFEIIEKAKQAQEKAKKEAKEPEPFVVILDEMNRTDISRVFGELFTAIEKRGEDVYLPLPAPKGKAKKSTKKLILNVPDNIYFIGTMNEIDFSLERIDFALRRRFIWELHDYSRDALESLINYKKDKIIKEDQYKSKIQENLDAYCNACTALNKIVEKKMNETYHIGHTFFAEIVDIYNKLIESGIKDYVWRKAKRILWQISIKPTLDAYCGTMPNEEKKSVMKDFEKAFFTNDENTSETNDDITNNSPDDEVNS